MNSLLEDDPRLDLLGYGVLEAPKHVLGAWKRNQH
jgi:hypothetical protein